MASVTPNCQHILPTTYNANINYGTTSCISNFSYCRHLSIKNRICSTVYMYMLCVHICVRACGHECLCVYVCMCVCLRARSVQSFLYCSGALPHLKTTVHSL